MKCNFNRHSGLFRCNMNRFVDQPFTGTIKILDKFFQSFLREKLLMFIFMVFITLNPHPFIGDIQL